MKPTTKVVFNWTNKNGTKCSLSTVGRYFKNYAVEFLEDEKIDKVRDVYYTVNNEVTHKLDYYNSML